MKNSTDDLYCVPHGNKDSNLKVAVILVHLSYVLDISVLCDWC